MSEIHLFIIWNNARNHESRIVNDINKRFKIVGLYEVFWDKKLFQKNLLRFYNDQKAYIIQKEKHCGTGPFLLLIIEDEHPIYGPRKTSKGTKIVNVNMFDLKEMYRCWSGGGHLIHGSNDIQESYHDLSFILGRELKKYLNREWDANLNIKKWKKNIIGLQKWNSLEDILFILNINIKYCILRNFENLPHEYGVGKHSDIDLLVDDYNYAKYLLNSKKSTFIPNRVQNIILIKNSYINVDLRYLGDLYYDEKWETKMLETRQIYNDFYVLNNENYFYSLIYHIIYHKNIISDDYIKKLNSIVAKYKGIDDYILLVDNYCIKNGYKICEPKDYTVTFKNRKRSLKVSFFLFLNRLEMKLRNR